MTKRFYASLISGGVATAAFAVGLVACTTAQLQSPAGQLFCDLQTAGGGTALVALIDAEATAAAPAAAPVAVIATGATKAFVDNACAQAAANTGAVSGVPVSPPAASAVVAPVAVTVAKVAS